MISCVNGICSREAPTNTIGRSGSWYYDGEKLELSYIGGPGVWFTVVKASPTHIELTDDRGDIIHLMRSTGLNILSPAITHASSRHCPPASSSSRKKIRPKKR